MRRNDDGTLTTSWYSKENASLNMLNFNSFHTLPQKINVVQNLIKSVVKLSSDMEPEDCLSTINAILKSNKYPKHFVNKQFRDFVQSMNEIKVITRNSSL